MLSEAILKNPTHAYLRMRVKYAPDHYMEEVTHALQYSNNHERALKIIAYGLAKLIHGEKGECTSFNFNKLVKLTSEDMPHDLIKQAAPIVLLRWEAAYILRVLMNIGLFHDVTYEKWRRRNRIVKYIIMCRTTPSNLPNTLWVDDPYALEYQIRYLVRMYEEAQAIKEETEEKEKQKVENAPQLQQRS